MKVEKSRGMRILGLVRERKRGMILMMLVMLALVLLALRMSVSFPMMLSVPLPFSVFHFLLNPTMSLDSISLGNLVLKMSFQVTRMGLYLFLILLQMDSLMSLIDEGNFRNL